jgi:hypothetical protein
MQIDTSTKKNNNDYLNFEFEDNNDEYNFFDHEQTY